MQITFIRHLPTEWNEKGRLLGRTDIEIMPLSMELEKGIEHNKQYLKQLAPFDIVLASSLRRTWQTADIYGYRCETETLLDELDFGPFEGYSEEELTHEYGERWLESPKSVELGESMAQLETRIKDFIKKYKHLTNILVFGHDSWIRGMISYSMFSNINQISKLTVEKNACFTLLVNPL